MRTLRCVFRRIFRINEDDTRQSNWLFALSLGQAIAGFKLNHEPGGASSVLIMGCSRKALLDVLGLCVLSSVSLSSEALLSSNTMAAVHELYKAWPVSLQWRWQSVGPVLLPRTNQFDQFLHFAWHNVCHTFKPI